MAAETTANAATAAQLSFPRLRYTFPLICLSG
jgi:hypothetical protein